MARLISYPTISTLALGDLFPVTDVSNVGKPLKNVTGTDLLGFIEANAGLWEKTATGINYPGGTVGIGATVPIASSMITVANTRTEPSTSVNSFYNLTYANTANSTASIYGTVNRYINSSSFSSKDLVSINNIARTTGTGAITNIYAAYNETDIEGSGNVNLAAGASNIAKLDNAGGTVGTISGTNSLVQLLQGEAATVKILNVEFAQSAGTSISGDLSYLYIANQTVSSITGTARAINSQSLLPSYFAGNVGIGATSPTEKLQVTGNVSATRFLGELSGSISTLTTAITKPAATNDTTVATTAFVQNLIGTIPTGLVFQGTWNAATNTPTLASGTGTTGHFYIVSVDGSTNLDGITDWKVGDWAVFVEQGATDAWEKVDNSSVLDGAGTGNQISKWAGSGTSNTLTDSIITDNGTNVGIGTTSPSEKLEVSGSNTLSIKLSRNNTDTTYVTTLTNNYNSSLGTELKTGIYNILTHGIGTGTFLNFTNGAMTFNYRNSEKMRIASSGNVGIGTTNPILGKLQVGGIIHVNRSGSNGTAANPVFENILQFGLNLTNISSVQLGNSFGSDNGTFLRFQVNSKNSASTPISVLTLDPFGNSTFTGLVSGITPVNAANFVTKAYVDGSGGGAGPFLPLAAGSGSPLTGDLYLKTTNDANIARAQIKWQTSQGTNKSFIRVGGSYADNALEFGTGNAILGMILHANAGLSIGTTVATALPPASGLLVQGNVGIGTTSPGAKLNVDGDVLIKSGEYLSWGTVGATSIEGSTASNKLQFRTNSADRMIINSSGNVGIGTNSPDHILCLEDTEPTLRIFDTANTLNNEQTISFGTEPGNRTHSEISGINLNTGNAEGGLIFKTNSGASLTEKMRIDSSGNVGIGTASPLRKLDIAVNATTDAARIKNTNSNGGGLSVFAANGGGGSNRILTLGDSSENVKVAVIENGNVGIGTTNPTRLLQLTAGEVFMRFNPTTVAGDYRFQAADGKFYVTPEDTGVPTMTYSSGNVGIGTTSPSFKLHVDSDVASGDVCFIHHDNASQSSGTVMKIRSDAGNNAGSALLNIENNTGNALYVRGDRNVGIGTTSPSQKLEVDGEVLSDGYRLAAMQTAPAARNSTGTLGEIIIDGNHLYVCYATNSWSRVALETAW